MRALLVVLLLLVAAPVGAASLWWEERGTASVDQALLDDVFAGKAATFEVAVDGREMGVEVDRRAGPNLGVSSLSGRFAGAAESFFLLCRAANGATVAFFQPGDGTAYRLDHTRGFPAVHGVDAQTMAGCAGGLKVSEIPGRRPQEPPAATPGAPDKTGEMADDGSRHDILVAYSPGAEAVAGGWDLIRAEAQLAVDAANLAYANSGIASTLRLVHVMGTDYQEIAAWDYDDHLAKLWNPSDGNLDEVLVMRETVGADFVSVLIDGRGFTGDLIACGVGYVMQPDEISQDFQDGALSIVSVQCAADAWSLAHEVGHNRGCAHNREDATVTGAYPYAFGHRFFVGSGIGLRTVMSYDDEAGTFARIPHFSNPDVPYAYEPTGVAPGLPGEAHNALVHNNTAAACAGFRPERTFVQFGWTEFSNGLILYPFSSLAQAITSSRVGGHIAVNNGDPGFTGVLQDRRTFVHAGAGSAVLGGN